MTFNVILASAAALLLTVSVGGLVAFANWYAERSARKVAGSGAIDVGSDPVDFDGRWDGKREVHQPYHQALVPYIAAVFVFIVGLLGSVAVTVNGADLPGAERFRDWLDIASGPFNDRFAACLMVAMMLALLALITTGMSILIGAPGLKRPPVLSESEDWTNFQTNDHGGLRGVGYLFYNKLLEATRVGTFQLVVLFMLLSLGGLAYVLSLSDYGMYVPIAVAAPSAGVLVAMGLHLRAPHCFIGELAVEVPPEKVREPHVLDVLAELGWTVPKKGAQFMLQDGTHKSRAIDRARLLHDDFAELDVSIKHADRFVRTERWAALVARTLTAYWRPERLHGVKAGSMLPFSSEAREDAKRGLDLTALVECVPTQILYAPESSGKAALVAWLALTEVLSSSETSPRRTLIIVPSARGDDELLRRTAVTERGRLNDALERIEYDRSNPQGLSVGGTVDDDICVTTLQGVLDALTNQPRQLAQTTLVSVLDVDLFTDIEYAQLREALHAVGTLLRGRTKPSATPLWILTTTTPASSDNDRFDRLVPDVARLGQKVGHIECVDDKLTDDHLAPVANSVELVVLSDCRTGEGEIPTIEDLARACEEESIPFAVRQRDAWWPTVRRHPISLPLDRWRNLEASHIHAHVTVIRDALIDGMSRASALLNANLAGKYRTSEGVVFLDAHPWEQSSLLGGSWAGQVGVKVPAGIASPGASLAYLATRAPRWPGFFELELGAANNEWGAVLNSSAMVDQIAFEMHWHVERGSLESAEHESTEPLCEIELSRDSRTLEWKPVALVKAANISQLPERIVSSVSLQAKRTAVAVWAGDRTPYRYGTEPSMQPYEAFASAQWLGADGVRTIKLSDATNDARHGAWSEAKSDDSAFRSATHVLPVRVIELVGGNSPQRIGAEKVQEWRDRAPFRMGLFHVMVDVRTVGTHAFDDFGVRIVNDYAEQSPAPSHETTALYIGSGEDSAAEDVGWSQDRAASMADCVRVALLTLMPAASALCHVDHAESPLTGGNWAVRVVDAGDVQLGLANWLATKTDVLSLLMTLAGAYDGPGDLALSRLRLEPEVESEGVADADAGDMGVRKEPSTLAQVIAPDIGKGDER